MAFGAVIYNVNGRKAKLKNRNDRVYLKVDKNSINKPFVLMDLNGNKVVKCFIEAIKNYDLTDANKYVSKYLKAIGGINFTVLKNIFDDENNYKCLKTDILKNNLDKLLKSSLLITGKKNQTKDMLIHLYMVKEPDFNGNWKICAIEQELI